jgi:ABC-2 type transport system ATP-binding protein
MLTLEHITFSYSRDPVLKDIQLNLESGLVHGLLGPNGSGKTTLFEIISGNLHDHEGRLLYSDKKPDLHTIAYQPTNPYFYSFITGREYLELHRRRNPQFQINEWNDIFNLPLNDLIETYSSGMKKKLSLMGIICLDRPVILLDEPFNNLDLEANQFLVRLLRIMAEKGKIIFLSSHFVEVITAVSDRIYLLEEGRIADTVSRPDFEEWKKGYRSSEISEAANRASKLL